MLVIRSCLKANHKDHVALTKYKLCSYVYIYNQTCGEKLFDEKN